MTPARALPVALIAAALACACRAPQEPRPGSGRGREPLPANYDPGQGTWGERWPVDVQALPAVWLRSDVADRLQPGEVAPDADGAGVALRGAIGNRDQSVGLLYQGMFLAAESPAGSDGDLDAHALYVDSDVRVPVRDGPEGFFVRAAVGLGAVRMDHRGARYDDRLTGAANLRFDLEFAPPGSGWALLAGVGGFVWGRPGDTEAFGTWFEVGGRIGF